MTEDWIQALGGIEAYRTRYRIVQYGIIGVNGGVGGLLLASLDAEVLENWTLLLIVAGLFATLSFIAAVFAWFVPAPDDLVDEEDAEPGSG